MGIILIAREADSATNIGDDRRRITKTMNSPLRLVALVLCSAVWVCAAPHAVAQTAYPSKPVQMIVPYTAGGGADVIVRAVAQRLAETWGRNVVIDNRPGASGMIGTELVAKAEPDGHTLLGHTSSYPATAAIRKKLPFLVIYRQSTHIDSRTSKQRGRRT